MRPSHSLVVVSMSLSFPVHHADCVVASPNVPRFAVGLVNYKTAEMTRACLELLRKALSGFDAEVWVVDNGSADESTTYLRSLDWIHLIERQPDEPEAGFLAHGRALNLLQARTSCEYLFLLHTDTLVYDRRVFCDLLASFLADPELFVAGCLDQIDRGRLRSAWRLATRFVSHQFRRAKLALGLPSKQPKPFRETYIKSFCVLWNLRIMRETGQQFLMSERIPGYEAQDVLLAAGYRRRLVSAHSIFRYLDHIEAGTVSANGGYRDGHRRAKKYRRMIGKDPVREITRAVPAAY